jgi:hypothetical protein
VGTEVLAKAALLLDAQDVHDVTWYALHPLHLVV